VCGVLAGLELVQQVDGVQSAVYSSGCARSKRRPSGFALTESVCLCVCVCVCVGQQCRHSSSRTLRLGRQAEVGRLSGGIGVGYAF
jgi:hypothetical protein